MHCSLLSCTVRARIRLGHWPVEPNSLTNGNYSVTGFPQVWAAKEGQIAVQLFLPFFKRLSLVSCLSFALGDQERALEIGRGGLRHPLIGVPVNKTARNIVLVTVHISLFLGKIALHDNVPHSSNLPSIVCWDHIVILILEGRVGGVLDDQQVLNQRPRILTGISYRR